jgi:hypothetical protein
MAKNWIKVGTILKGKEGSNNYLKVDIREGKNKLESVTLKSGQTLSCFNPRKKPGITEDELAKIPDFVLADVMISPDKS